MDLPGCCRWQQNVAYQASDSNARPALAPIARKFLHSGLSPVPHHLRHCTMFTCRLTIANVLVTTTRQAGRPTTTNLLTGGWHNMNCYTVVAIKRATKRTQ